MHHKLWQLMGNALIMSIELIWTQVKLQKHLQLHIITSVHSFIHSFSILAPILGVLRGLTHPPVWEPLDWSITEGYN